MGKDKIAMAVFLMGAAGVLCQGESGAVSVLDLFPDSGRISVAEGTRCSFDYEPAGSRWTPGVDEEKVFLAAIQGEAWRLGIGKGGQIYSLRGPYGESVPPQRVASPWNDEVWQFVITNEQIINRIQDYQNVHAPTRRQQTAPLMYFIHQAGIYVAGAGVDGGSVPAPFYSPCLRKRWIPDAQTLEMVNWIQQARTPCVWKSGVLLYTAYRDLGRGVIEVNQVAHNFGTEPLGHLNAPWGGVRHSSLPHTILSNPDGSWEKVTGQWGWQGIPDRDLHDTGGWIAWVQDPEDEASPALALVVGTSRERLVPARTGRSRFIRWGTAARVETRDYEVTAQVTKVDMQPGDSLSARWYLVSGTFAGVRDLAAEMSDSARVTRIEFDTAPRQPVWIRDGRVATEGEGEPWIMLQAFPSPGTLPVFLLEDKRTGEQVITADPYALAETEPFPNPLPEDFEGRELYDNRVIYRQYLPHIGYEDLLGFAAVEKTGAAGRRIQLPPGIERVHIHESAKDLWIP